MRYGFCCEVRADHRFLGELGIAPSRALYYAKGVVALRVRVFHFSDPNLLLASQYLQDRFSAQTDL